MDATSSLIPRAALPVAGLAGLLAGTACGALAAAASPGQAGIAAGLAALAASLAAVTTVVFLTDRQRRAQAMPEPLPGTATAAAAALPPMLEAALDAAPMPVMILAADKRLAARNAAARDRFAQIGAGARLEALFRQPDLIAAVEDSYVDGRMRQVSVSTLVPIERFERATIAPFEDGGVRYVLITFVDETEQRVSERMRADFLANASHELRTPLASIAGFIETLRGPARDDAEARDRFLKIMDDQAGRMSRLLSDLSSLSRIELFERLAPTGEQDLATIVLETVEALPARDLIQVSGAEAPVPVMGDRDQLVQVLTNLVDNAVKYGGGGPVRLRLGSGLEREQALQAAGRQWEAALRLPLTSPAHDPGRRYAVLRVEDAGPGIAREELPRLTERFYRVEASARGVPGTGLGLAIVKHIVNRHRGGLLVETRSGAGTSFACYLPQPEGSDPPAAAP